MIPRLTSVVMAITPRVLIPAFVYFSIAVINIDQTNVGWGWKVFIQSTQYSTSLREEKAGTQVRNLKTGTGDNGEMLLAGLFPLASQLSSFYNSTTCPGLALPPGGLPQLAVKKMDPTDMSTGQFQGSNLSVEVHPSP